MKQNEWAFLLHWLGYAMCAAFAVLGLVSLRLAVLGTWRWWKALPREARASSTPIVARGSLESLADNPGVVWPPRLQLVGGETPAPRSGPRESRPPGDTMPDSDPTPTDPGPTAEPAEVEELREHLRRATSRALRAERDVTFLRIALHKVRLDNSELRVLLDQREAVPRRAAIPPVAPDPTTR